MTADLASLDEAKFQPLVNTLFQLRLPGPAEVPSVNCRLLSVRSLGRAWKEGMRAPFALLFLAPPEAGIPQGTYRFKHAAFGDAEDAGLDLFVVPVGRTAEGLQLEAVFS